MQSLQLVDETLLANRLSRPLTRKLGRSNRRPLVYGSCQSTLQRLGMLAIYPPTGLAPGLPPCQTSRFSRLLTRELLVCNRKLRVSGVAPKFIKGLEPDPLSHSPFALSLRNLKWLVIFSCWQSFLGTYPLAHLVIIFMMTRCGMQIV